MRTYIIRRLAQMVPVFLGIMLILFLLLQLAPGGPTGMLMDPRMSAEQKQELAEKYGENKPFYEKFISWMADAAKGNFGNSITHKKPVVEVIKDFIGNTFLLAIVSLLVGLFIGVPIGIVSATKQYSAVDYGTTIFSLIGVSLPAFFFGLLLLKIFAVELPVVPDLGLTNRCCASGLDCPRDRQSAPPCPARHSAGVDTSRVIHALYAFFHAGGDPPGLCPHSARQRAQGQGCHLQTRFPERDDSDYHSSRILYPRLDLRCADDRDYFFAARPWQDFS